MNIVNGVDIDQGFTGEEIVELHNKGKLKGIVLEGYVTRLDILDNLIRFVPWHESTWARSEENRTINVDMTEPLEMMREEVEREHPILRRTPQERVAALALRLMGEVKRDGGRALTPLQRNRIVGESWKEGEPITGSDVETIAAHFMGKAEQANREADSKRITRKHMTA